MPAISAMTAFGTLTRATLAARQTWRADRPVRGLPVLIAEQDGLFAGLAFDSDPRPWDGERPAVEHCVDVHPDAPGLGRALLDGVIERAKVQGKQALAGIAGNDGFDRWPDPPCMGRLLGRSVDPDG